ncbi:MAG: PilZ domain-containing protein [Candidatus Schekmanbacteria bacterium]|nr:PilZ domain-containing protein [Candidatus Schekmanbacteria bacterium]
MVGRDRRRYLRIAGRHLLSYETVARDVDSDGVGIGKSRNFSLDGVMIEIDRDFALEKILSLEIELEGKRVIVRARVRHRQKMPDGRFELGLQFVRISDEDLVFLSRYFHENIGNAS